MKLALCMWDYRVFARFHEVHHIKTWLAMIRSESFIRWSQMNPKWTQNTQSWPQPWQPALKFSVFDFIDSRWPLCLYTKDTFTIALLLHLCTSTQNLQIIIYLRLYICRKCFAILSSRKDDSYPIPFPAGLPPRALEVDGASWKSPCGGAQSHQHAGGRGKSRRILVKIWGAGGPPVPISFKMDFCMRVFPNLDGMRHGASWWFLGKYECHFNHRVLGCASLDNGGLVMG